MQASGEGTREAEIPCQMKQFESSFSTLVESIKDLYGRLEPVLHPPEPSPPENTKAMPGLCAMGQWFATQREKVEEATGVIRGILKQLEI